MLYKAYLIKIHYNTLMEQYNSKVDSTKKLTKNDLHTINYIAEMPDLID